MFWCYNYRVHEIMIIISTWSVLFDSFAVSIDSSVCLNVDSVSLMYLTPKSVLQRIIYRV